MGRAAGGGARHCIDRDGSGSPGGVSGDLERQGVGGIGKSGSGVRGGGVSSWGSNDRSQDSGVRVRVEESGARGSESRGSGNTGCRSEQPTDFAIALVKVIGVHLASWQPEMAFCWTEVRGEVNGRWRWAVQEGRLIEMKGLQRAAQHLGRRMVLARCPSHVIA